MISVERAREILDHARGRPVLVVGDLMLDRYVSGSVDRISPEAPVPVICVREEHCLPGGASNVARNIQALGGQAVVVGAVGMDRAGDQLMSVLNEGGIRTEGVVRDARVATCQKTRILAERQQVCRVDREDPPEAVEALSEALCERAADLARRVEGIIIEDYGKGVVSQAVVDAVLAVAEARGVPVGLDPKDNHELGFSFLSLATPNYREACSAAGLPMVPLGGDLTVHPNLVRAGDILQGKWHTELLMITLGAHGMFLLSRGRSPVWIPTQAQEVFDVCGAGDTVIATATLAWVAGATHDEAALLSNCAAGLVVGKVGAATCTPPEVLGAIRAAGGRSA
jgi:D-glycero-beta-D-manno-heptose-7-phosphate kinase